MQFLSKDRIIAPPGFNRWWVSPASVAIHLCIGSVYAWSTAGVLGPLAISHLRERTELTAIHSLAGSVSSGDFQRVFGATLESLDKLVATRTVTITRLMEIAPAGTINPTSSLYNTPMYLMAGLLGIALIANLLIRPVDARHFRGELSVDPTTSQ